MRWSSVSITRGTAAAAAAQGAPVNMSMSGGLSDTCQLILRDRVESGLWKWDLLGLLRGKESFWEVKPTQAEKLADFAEGDDEGNFGCVHPVLPGSAGPDRPVEAEGTHQLPVKHQSKSLLWGRWWQWFIILSTVVFPFMEFLVFEGSLWWQLNSLNDP